MLDIIYNPISGKGKSASALKITVQALTDAQTEYRIHETAYVGHAKEIAEELNQQEDCKLMILGGDGTFNEVLNGITDFDKITVGFIPCGTGNDYVRAAKLPVDTVAAVNAVLAGKTAYSDFIQLGVRRALNCAGAGMDVDVLVRYSNMKAFKGKTKYYASLIDTLLHLKFHKLRLTINGESSEKNVFLITAANGTCIGGGMPISPSSDPFDGVLNIVVINEMKKRKILGALLAFLKGKHIGKPYTETYTCTEALIEILDEGKTEVDGEVFDNKILDCKLVSGKLRIFK
ncbi:MAG: YegS/Rv2252/BmrU family lipid kinase [Clostridiaceae bacterium]|nr:YegS/Rv2252/BmrU family lipid kinase [Clostridiaceae bacterium]